LNLQWRTEDGGCGKEKEDIWIGRDKTESMRNMARYLEADAPRRNTDNGKRHKEEANT